MLKVAGTFIATILLLILDIQTVNAKSLAALEKDFELDNGFVGVIHDAKEGKVYLKIDNLDQEFIYISSLPVGLGSNDIGLDRGQQGNSRLAVFERVANKVFLKQKNTQFIANSNNRKELLAVEEAFATSILWGFSVVDSGEGWVLVDASDFVLQDIHGVGRRLQEKTQGNNYQVDKTRSAIYMPRTTAFPDNTELEATITLVGDQPGEYVKQVSPDPHAISLRMHHSFVRLPAKGYQPRTYLPKSGFWSVSFQDYAQPINHEITQRFIGRHRLAKKDPKVAVSEAVKPIIYYLDPGVPEPVKSALIDGAMWWDKAFEAIGYKNAFQVKMLPANADPMDVRYNVIQWVHRATRGWSYGLGVTDPRTGEIIKGHVTLGSLRARHDYLIAQGILAPFASGQEDKALIDLSLARIRQLSAHEVGHTLGLNHNFAASHTNNNSVMDYPHPRFEIQGDKVVAPNPYGVGIGAWDKAAIRYGYQDYDSGKEAVWLAQLIAENNVAGLIYVADPDARKPGSAHAHASLWDNGRDPIVELAKMKRIRQMALEKFGAANLKLGRPWSDLEEVLMPVYYFHRYQLAAVAKWLGGLEYDYSIKRDQQVSTQKIVSGEEQTRALKAMIETLEPDFLLLPASMNNKIIPKAAEYQRTRESVTGFTGTAFDSIALAEASAQHTLGLLLEPTRLARLIEQSASGPTVPTIDSVATELHQLVIEQNYEGLKASIHQSVVHLIYSNYLNLLQDPAVSVQVKMQIMGVLLKEKDYLLRKLTAVRRTSSYYGFYAYQSKRLDELSIENKDVLIPLPQMPPGSPI